MSCYAQTPVDAIILGDALAVQALVARILDPERSVALVVASTLRGREEPAIDLAAVREVLGKTVAIYVLLPGKPVSLLASLLPPGWGVRNGALRIYQPVPGLRPREHPLIVDDKHEYTGKALKLLAAEWNRTKAVPTREHVARLQGERLDLSHRLGTLREQLAVATANDPAAASLKTDLASRVHRLICEEWVQATSEAERQIRSLGRYRLTGQIVHDLHRRQGVAVTGREIAAVMAAVASGRLGALHKLRPLLDAAGSRLSAATTWECELDPSERPARLRFTRHPIDGTVFQSIVWEPSMPDAEAEDKR